MSARTAPRVCIVISALLASAGGAGAVEWRLSAFARQGVSAVSGFGDDNDGEELRSTTDLGANITARTKTTTWSLSPGVNLSMDGDDDPSTNFRFSGSVAHVAPRLALDGSLSVVPRFVSDRDFETLFDETAPGEPIVVGTTTRDVDPLEILIRGSAGARYQIDGLNSVAARGFVVAREYDQNTDRYQPSQTVGGSLSWSRTLDAVTSGSLSGSVRHFMSDRSDQEDSTSYTLSIGGSQSLTPRHNVSVSLGATGVDGEDFDVRFSGSAGLSYRTAQGSYRIGVDQQVAQDDFGEVSTITSISASASHTINSVSSVGVGARAATETPIFGSADNEDRLVFSVSPRYRLSLTDSWTMSVGYGFRGEYEDGSFSGSNRLFLQISTGFESPF